MRASLLLRSGQHNNATPEDLQLVTDLKIERFVDLRSRHERTQYPCRRAPGFQAEQLIFHPYDLNQAPHEQAASFSAHEVVTRLEGLYRIIPFSPHMREAFRLYFETVASAQGPVVVHCAAGKDRTGVAVALMLAMAGVHKDDIMGDFLLTNVAGTYEARERAFAGNFRHGLGAGMSDEAVRAALDVQPTYLQCCFEEITQRAGGLMAYLSDFLNIPVSTQHKIIQKIVQ